MNFHSISLVFTLKTIVEEQICAINEVIGYTWAIAQVSPKRETGDSFLFLFTKIQSIASEGVSFSKNIIMPK